MNMIEMFQRWEDEVVYQIMIMGLPVVYDTITDPYFGVKCISKFRIKYFEMDADAKQSLKWFTYIDHGSYTTRDKFNPFAAIIKRRFGTTSHCVWYEDVF